MPPRRGSINVGKNNPLGKLSTQLFQYNYSSMFMRSHPKQEVGSADKRCHPCLITAAMNRGSLVSSGNPMGGGNPMAGGARGGNPMMMGGGGGNPLAGKGNPLASKSAKPPAPKPAAAK